MIPELVNFPGSALNPTPKKKTLGQQVLENAAKYDGQFLQDVRETTDEMGKQWNRELGKIIEGNKHLVGKYYINIILKKEIMFENVLKAIFVIRRTRPTPVWNSTVYSFNNDTQDLLLEWVLPSADEAAFMLRDPEGWDPSLIKDIYDFVNGRLT
jgi:hypothetical protein